MPKKNKPRVLFIEIGMKNVGHFKEYLGRIKEGKIFFEKNFIKLMDMMYRETYNIILISNIRGKESTKDYIFLLKKKNPNSQIIVISVNDVVSEEEKEFYIEAHAAAVFSFKEVKETKKFVIELCKQIKQEEWFQKEWSDCTKKVIRFIKDNYENLNKKIIETISKNVNYSKSTIHYLIKKDTGKTVSDWIRTCRIKGSILLYERSNYKINQLYKAVGYKSLKGFIQAFKKETGYTPKQYIKNF